MQTVHRWLEFLEAEDAAQGAEAWRRGDASGFALEHALELFALGAERAHSSSAVLTVQLPEGVSPAFGSVGWILSIRAGEDLDLRLLGGGEWSTLHLDLLAANPLISMASEAAAGGRQALRRLLALAAEAGRAVTVEVLDEQQKEQYRRMGFREDSLLDPSLMFWVPSQEGLMALRC